MQGTINNQKVDTGNKLFTEGLILAGITLFGYLTAYCYESSYLSFFGTPVSLARIEPVTVVIAMGSFLLASLSILNLFSLVITTIHKVAVTRVQKFVVQWITMFLLFVGIPILIFGKTWQGWIGFFAFYILYLVVDLISLFFVFRKEGSYEERLEKWHESEAKANAKTVTDLLLDRLGLKAFGFLLLAIIFLFISGAVGIRNAIQQENFFVLSTNPELVVIYINDSQIVAAPFNRESKKSQKHSDFLP